MSPFPTRVIEEGPSGGALPTQGKEIFSHIICVFFALINTLTSNNWSHDASSSWKKVFLLDNITFKAKAPRKVRYYKFLINLKFHGNLHKYLDQDWLVCSMKSFEFFKSVNQFSCECGSDNWSFDRMQRDWEPRGTAGSIYWQTLMFNKIWNLTKLGLYSLPPLPL